MKRILNTVLMVLTVAAVSAQQSLDFAEKFITLCKSDSTVKCITISPKMMEQLVKQHLEEKPENIVQAIEKLKSARIVSARAALFEKADSLLKKHKRRFTAVKEYGGTDSKIHGAFYSRKNKKGQTVELVMLREDAENNSLTIVNLTGDIDEEFLCFLYNNKTFKN